MTMLSPPDQPPFRGGRRVHGASHRHGWVDAVLIVVSILVVSCVLCQMVGLLGATTALTGLPDPWFNRSVTYTPNQGPPNPILLDTRPETVIAAYLNDYIRLAGTYPCAQNLSTFDSTRAILSLPCPVSRPVSSFAITSVTIQPQGLLEAPLALTRFTITYQDGTRWASEIDMVPDYHSFFGYFYVHLDCWGSIETDQIFPRLVPDVPRGISYGPPGGPYSCQR